MLLSLCLRLCCWIRQFEKWDSEFVCGGRGSIYTIFLCHVYFNLNFKASVSSVRWDTGMLSVRTPRRARFKRETGSFGFQDFKLDSDTEQVIRQLRGPLCVHHRDRANFSLSRHTFVRVPAGARLRPPHVSLDTVRPGYSG